MDGSSHQQRTVDDPRSSYVLESAASRDEGDADEMSSRGHPSSELSKRSDAGWLGIFCTCGDQRVDCDEIRSYMRLAQSAHLTPEVEFEVKVALMAHGLTNPHLHEDLLQFVCQTRGLGGPPLRQLLRVVCSQCRADVEAA